VVTGGCSADPTPVPRPMRSEPGEPAGSSQERVGCVGRQGSMSMCPRAPLLRSASLARQGFPLAMPMAARGPASPRSERSCSRGFHRRQIPSGRRRGRPRAGEASARARQFTRRPDASPPRLSPPGEGTSPPGERGGPDARKVGARRGAVGTASNHDENRDRERSGRAPDASGPRRWPGGRSRRSTR